MNLLVCQFLSVVLKVFGFAWGNLLGSLSALAKQERMLVINDISGALAVSHAVTPTYHRAHNRDNGISVKRAFMQHTNRKSHIPRNSDGLQFFNEDQTPSRVFYLSEEKQITPPSEGFVLLAVYLHQNVVKKLYFILLQMEQQGGGVSVQGHSWDAKCQ